MKSLLIQKYTINSALTRKTYFVFD